MTSLPMAAVLAATFLLSAGAALAQSMTAAIGVQGYVSPRCGASNGGGNIFIGTVARAAGTPSASASPIAFQLGCNGTAATIMLNAARVATPTQGSSDDTGFLVDLHAVDMGGANADAFCPSATVAGRRCSLRGPASATLGMRMPGAGGAQGSYLRVHASAAGRANITASPDRSDILVLTLSPSA